MQNCFLGWFLVHFYSLKMQLSHLLDPPTNHSLKPKEFSLKSSHNVNISKATVSGNITLSINPQPPYPSQGGHKPNKQTNPKGNTGTEF